VRPRSRPTRAPALTVRRVAALVRRADATHVRELEALLWHALSSGTGEVLDLWPGEDAPAAAPPAEDPPGVDPMSIPPEAIQAALDAHDGRQEGPGRARARRRGPPPGQRHRHRVGRRLGEHRRRHDPAAPGPRDRAAQVGHELHQGRRRHGRAGARPGPRRHQARHRRAQPQARRPERRRAPAAELHRQRGPNLRRQGVVAVHQLDEALRKLDDWRIEFE
jgi:hypothetical protein